MTLSAPSLCLLGACLTSTLAFAGSQIAAGPGHTTLRFRPGALEVAGLRVEFASEADSPSFEQVPGRAVYEARIVGPSRDAPDDLHRLEAAVLEHQGTLEISTDRRSRRVEGFEIRVVPGTHQLELRTLDGELLFELHYPHARMLGSRLDVTHMDMRISVPLAADLDAPELAGHFVGEASFQVELPLPAQAAGVTAAGVPCTPDFDPELSVDVELTQIRQINQVAEAAGFVALAPGADLRNSGERDVAWFRSIAPDGGAEVGPHPFLSMHLYRLHGRELVQLAQSDVKHAFFAVNSGCPCGGSQVLFAGCSDFYSSATNSDRRYLAPRDEVDPFTGEWESEGSHFDGTPVDDFRHHQGESDHDALEHLLFVDAGELAVAGAEYFVEAWYVVAGDSDLLNGVGRRQVLPLEFAPLWEFEELGALRLGSVLDEVVAPGEPGAMGSSEWLDTGEGRLQLATRVEELEGGFYDYELSLMNFDTAAGVGKLTFSVPAGTKIDELGFTPSGRAASWEASLDGAQLSWTAPAGAFLGWGALASFRFRADSPPAPSTLVLLSASGAALGGVGSLLPQPLPEPAVGLMAVASIGALWVLRTARADLGEE